MAGKSTQPTASTKATTPPTTPAAEPEVAAAAAGKDGGKGSSNTQEAKSRFNAALNEAKAGAAALGQEAKTRASSYRSQAKTKGEGWQSDAKTRAGDFATQGKAKASEALVGLSRIVDENAPTLDEKLGPKYGDYARSASRSIQSTADSLNQKNVDELAEDGREAIRKNPAAAVGIAALAGFLFARLFRR